MKATGIVRRIDDLGRVVIPKELRRTMRLREGAPLEIFTEKDGELIFKKYSPIGELSDFAGDLCESLRRASETAAAICDRDSVIAVAGAARKELAGKAVSAALGELMDRRAPYRRGGADSALPLCEDAGRYSVAVAEPIFCEGDVAGCVLFFDAEGKGSGGETEEKLARAAAHFLGRQLEG
jgi:AbrB family transcriptional regulator (stage V sporulation protein T)